MKTTLVLGAGFSKNSGLPLEAEILALMINEKPRNEFEKATALVLKKFMKNVYGYSENGVFPGLDDMLTCIDISTNSGHHLGIDYSPMHLRAIRRIIMFRIFSMMERLFKPSDEVKELIRHFPDAGFIVLNWDSVLEKYIISMFPDADIDYCNGSVQWNGNGKKPSNIYYKVLKPHGSCNWLYCDNCRNLFSDSHGKISPEKKAGFLKSDLQLFDEFRAADINEEALQAEKCTACGNTLSSHIATFSYRKTFRANSFPDIWKEAESMLSTSDRWIFIGYSLPDADYEFKHLLKISELKFRHKRKENLQINVVVLDDKGTVEKYRGFFGNGISIYGGGLKEYLKQI